MSTIPGTKLIFVLIEGANTVILTKVLLGERSDVFYGGLGTIPQKFLPFPLFFLLSGVPAVGSGLVQGP